MLREVNLLLILAGMMLGPLLFNLRAVAVTLRDLRCAAEDAAARLRRRPARGQRERDEPAAAVGSWAVVVEDEVQPEPARAARNAAAPQRAVSLRAGRPVAQGRLPRAAGPPRALSPRAAADLHAVSLRTVLPHDHRRPDRDAHGASPPGAADRGWVARRHEAFAGTHRRERRHGTEGDFYGVREWRSGDSRRWIHWRSSARSGELVVRQFEQPRNRDVAVLLDLWQPRGRRRRTATTWNWP